MTYYLIVGFISFILCAGIVFVCYRIAGPRCRGANSAGFRHVWGKWIDVPDSIFQYKRCGRCGLRKVRYS